MNPDDPRFSAYALNETSTAESEIIETALFRDPALLAEMHALQRFTDRLETALKTEDAPPLHAHQRQNVLAACGCLPRATSGPERWWQRGPVLAAAAACILLGLGAAIYFQARHLDGLRPALAGDSPSPSEVTVRFADTETGAAANFEPTAELPAHSAPAALQAIRGIEPTSPTSPNLSIDWTTAPTRAERVARLPEGSSKNPAQQQPAPATVSDEITLYGRMPEAFGASRQAEFRAAAPSKDKKKPASNPARDASRR
jgi:hypothetical protein